MVLARARGGGEEGALPQAAGARTLPPAAEAAPSPQRLSRQRRWGLPGVAPALPGDKEAAGCFPHRAVSAPLGWRFRPGVVRRRRRLKSSLQPAVIPVTCSDICHRLCPRRCSPGTGCPGAIRWQSSPRVFPPAAEATASPTQEFAPEVTQPAASASRVLNFTSYVSQQASEEIQPGN